MKTKKELFNDIYNQSMRIHNKMNILQRIPMDYGSGEQLHLSEIHAIEAIAENPDTHMADLAKLLGVTRGALMQMTDRLEKKGYTEKYMAEDNQKLVYFRLKSKGEVVYRGHLEYHHEMNSRIFSCLKNIASSDIEASAAILDKIEFYMNRYVNEKKALSKLKKKR